MHDTQLDKNSKRKIWTVTELNRHTRKTVEQTFSQVWVQGEISNFSTPSSGHWYFTLKDLHAQVRCAMFRYANQTLRWRPKDGEQVVVCANASLYEPRGDFQLLVERMEPAGLGRLQLAFEQLKARLWAEGLFAEQHKKPIPKMPRCIGVITSLHGAALHDVLTVLSKRCASLPIIIYPSLVQGSEAPAQLIRALQCANARQECDVLLLVRGGGSLEDLWCFNDEALARAIYASVIPVVSGVGHEVDVTIADFVADYRAPTPSAAAMTVSPDLSDYVAVMQDQARRLLQSYRRLLVDKKQQIIWLQQRLVHPRQRLARNAQQVDEYYLRLQHAWQRRYTRQQQSVQTMRIMLLRYPAAQLLMRQRHGVAEQRERLCHSMQRFYHERHQTLAVLKEALRAMNPQATLLRGYSITYDVHTGAVVRDPRRVAVGAHIKTQLAKGSLVSSVVKAG